MNVSSFCLINNLLFSLDPYLNKRAQLGREKGGMKRKDQNPQKTTFKGKNTQTNTTKKQQGPTKRGGGGRPISQTFHCSCEAN